MGRIFARISQPFDFPVLLNLPESRSLKGLIHRLSERGGRGMLIGAGLVYGFGVGRIIQHNDPYPMRSPIAVISSTRKSALPPSCSQSWIAV